MGMLQRAWVGSMQLVRSLVSRPAQRCCAACRDPEMYLLDGQPYASSGHNTVLTKGSDEVRALNLGTRTPLSCGTGMPPCRCQQVSTYVF